jgi:hypothetical protein
VEDAVHKPNARALVRVLVRQLNVDLPETALEGCCELFQHEILVVSTACLTLFWTLESDKELLPARYVSNLCNDGLETGDRVRTLQDELANAYFRDTTKYDHTVVVDQSDFVVAHHPSPVVRDARDGTSCRSYVHPVTGQYTRQWLICVYLRLTSSPISRARRKC